MFQTAQDVLNQEKKIKFQKSETSGKNPIGLEAAAFGYGHNLQWSAARGTASLLGLFS